MLIEAKSTRQTEEPQQGRKRFEFNTAERLSRLPALVALVSVGLAAYLKSALEARGISPLPEAAPAGPAPQLTPPVDWCVPDDFDFDLAQLEPGVDDIITGSTGETAEPRNQIGRGLPWPSDLVLPDYPSLIFASPMTVFSPSIEAFFPVVFGVASDNDNRLNPPTVPGGPVGGGDDGEGPGNPPAGGGDPENPPQTPKNRAPLVSGPVRLNDVFAGQVVLIGLSQLLFGASDPDGDALGIFNLTVTGTTMVRVANGWSLTTQPGMLGPVTFTYQVSDGQSSVTQTAYLEIIRNVQTLTPGADIFVGTPFDDDIDGLAGDDIIDALAGNDVVDGGLGDDHINGGAGDDYLMGGAGNDIIFGGAGSDSIFGRDDNDRLFGEGGDDIIDGGAGNDFLSGGDGRDILDGGSGNDQLFGGAGDDAMRGGSGNDQLSGEAGNDILDGGDGCDRLDGGEGDDVLDGGSGNDLLFGGAGNDVMRGGSGHDQLSGEAGNDILDGGAGCDLLDGGAGDDVLSGGAGDDTIGGGSGDDRILADAGDDIIDGGEGHDTLDMSAACDDLVVNFVDGIAQSNATGTDRFASIERVIGGSGDDVFVIGATAVVASGGRGNDMFIFEVTDQNPGLSEDVVHDILDFVVGDRIRVREYDISREAERAERDLFRSIYDDDDDWLKSDLPIIVRHERYDDMDQTIIMADVDGDSNYEITINIYGVLLPYGGDNNLA